MKHPAGWCYLHLYSLLYSCSLQCADFLCFPPYFGSPPSISLPLSLFSLPLPPSLSLPFSLPLPPPLYETLGVTLAPEVVSVLYLVGALTRDERNDKTLNISV